MIFNKKFKKLNVFKRINFRVYNILYALIVMWIILFFSNKNFGTFDNIMSILRESSFVGITAIGMTFCIISGFFDLSVGSMVALLCIETVWLVGKFGLIPALILVFASGFILGIFNGFIVSRIRIPAFITTLGTFYIFRAAAYIVTDGAPLKFSEKWFTIWGNGTFFHIPRPFIFFVILVIIGTLLLRATPFGRYTLAIGNSESASKIAGINSANVKLIIFGLVGLFTAISAFFISSRLWSANPKMLEGYEFRVIAAVVLGGTSLSGGKGSIFNTLISAIFFVSITNAMVLYRIDSFVIQVVTGLILLFAFSLDTIRLMLERIFIKLRTRKIKYE